MDRQRDKKGERHLDPENWIDRSGGVQAAHDGDWSLGRGGPRRRPRPSDTDCDFCFKVFGDRMKNWFTFNESRYVAALECDNGIHAPGRCFKCIEGGDSRTELYIAAHHLILSHVVAVHQYREKYQVHTEA